MGLRGPQKGAKYLSTITKSQAREATRVAIQKHVDRMLRSQIAHACGIGHMFTRDKSGKFTKIESEKEGTRLLAEGEENKDYWIFFKDPSVQAFTDLMNRAQDKPKEQEIQVTVTHELEIVPLRLAAARKRLAGHTATAAIEQATEPSQGLATARQGTEPATELTGAQRAIQQALQGHPHAATGQTLGQSGDAAYARAIDGELLPAEPSPVSAAITKALVGEGLE
jgi:hypothetical protein